MALLVTAISTPIVGSSSTGYGQQEWVAALVVLALAILILCIRRYAAARDAGWGSGSSVLYAIDPWKRPARGQAAPDSRGLLIGMDNRTSTSKTAAALWTVIVVYFIVTMALVLGFNRTQFDSLIGDTSPIYLVFLGGPFAAAVLAKATVNGAVTGGTAQRSTASSPRVADVFSDDDGNSDLVDLQYVAFNLVVAIIVLVQFLHAPNFGAPAVPSFLAGLTSASAATYVANKALITGAGNTPTINQMAPPTARRQAEVVVMGANFVAPGATDDDRPKIFVAGNLVQPTDSPPVADHSTFRVPATLPFGATPVKLVTASGLSTDPSSLQIVDDQILVTMAQPLNGPPGTLVTIYGQGFFAAPDVDAAGKPVNAGGGIAPIPARAFLTDPAGNKLACPAVEGASTDSQLVVTLPDGIAVPVGAAAPAACALTVLRGPLPEVVTGITITVQ